MTESRNRWRRFDEWDAEPLRLENFAVEDPENGFPAMAGAADPKPSLTLEAGNVAVMDGTKVAGFDLIDAFIVSYHLDSTVVPEAMAMPSVEVAPMLVDVNVPRTDLVRRAHCMTQAKLTADVAQLSAIEMAISFAEMRPRKTPGNQGHVTNAKDDLLPLAADALTVVALDVDEIETTMRVSAAPSPWSW